MPVPDKIERQVTFNASRDKVWDAITQADMISRWFGDVATISKFEVGGEMLFGWTHLNTQHRAIIETIEPKQCFAYRWERHDADFDKPFAEVESTLVTFTLEEVADGTQLTVVETGFADLPNPEQLFEGNSDGWDSELDDLKTLLEVA